MLISETHSLTHKNISQIAGDWSYGNKHPEGEARGVVEYLSDPTFNIIL